jgi:tetratricopeptide (TPR) repeat protein
MKMSVSGLPQPVCVALAIAMIAALPLRAQTRDEDRAACLSSDSDTSIAGCTADIKSGAETTSDGLALAYYNRGLSYAHKHDYEAAIADYTKAIELKGGDSKFHDARGEAYYNLGDFSDAKTEFSAALKIDPDDEVAKEDLAQANAP